jgi:anti-anti-sigma factor
VSTALSERLDRVAENTVMDDEVDTQRQVQTQRLEFLASVAPAADSGSVVTIIGELDVDAARKVSDAFDEAIARPGPVKLDMRGCSFVDSTGIAALVRAARQLHEDDRTLSIRGARPRVRGILELSGLLSQGWILLEPEPGS